MPIKRVLEAIEDIKNGKMVIMVDDEDRENEGDIVFSATLSTADKVNFMASEAKGLICVPVSKDIAERLELTPMVKENDETYQTAFTISVDAKECTTGISAFERDMTIKLLANPISKSKDFMKPGHIFPLVAKDGGVLVRTGHTEGSVDLCKLSGLSASAVICEIMKSDGTMARRDDLDLFAKKHNLKIVYISDLVEYRLKNESLITEINNSKIEFFNQQVKKVEFKDHKDNIHSVIIFGNINETTSVKFHNITIDRELFFNSNRWNSLNKSIDYLKKNNGILIFLGHKTESEDKIKEYGIGAQILKSLNIENIKLLTSGKHKNFIGISGFGLNVIDEIEI